MADRRPLTEGLKSPTPSSQEKAFVYGEPTQKATIPTAAPNTARVPISTRIRGDFAVALKRCSLQRQLEGLEPNTLQDILEQAIEPSLKSNGYLP